MRIDGSIGTGMPLGPMGMSQGTDVVTRNIQRQIAEVEKRLQELSEKDDMTPEEKMKRRQELQQQISDLNNQLRQHQIEQRREQQQRQQDNSMDDLLGGSPSHGTKAAKGQKTGMSQKSMKAMVQAGAAMDLAKNQEQVAVKLEGQARVLGGEIKQDERRGLDVTEKKNEQTELLQNASEVRAMGIKGLTEADEAMTEAAKKVVEEEKENDEGGKAEGASEQTEKNAQAEAGSGIGVNVDVLL